VKVEETYEGVEGGLRRTLTWAPTPDFTPTITHPAGLERTELAGSPEGRRVFTYLWK
jgi:hypothetical protein